MSLAQALFIAVAALSLSALEGARRKATESVAFDLDENETQQEMPHKTDNVTQTGSKTVLTQQQDEEVQMEYVPCPGLIWELMLENKLGDGWKGSSLLLSSCDGILLLNATLPHGSMARQSICLPEQFAVEVRPSSAAANTTALWQLSAKGAPGLAGGVPFKGGLCERELPKPVKSALHKMWAGAYALLAEHVTYYTEKPEETLDLMALQRLHLIGGKGPAFR